MVSIILFGLMVGFKRGMGIDHGVVRDVWMVVFCWGFVLEGIFCGDPGNMILAGLLCLGCCY